MAHFRQSLSFSDQPLSPAIPSLSGGVTPQLRSFKFNSDADSSRLSVITSMNDMNYRDAPASPSASSVTTLSNYDSLASPEPPLPPFSYDNDRIQNNLLEEICSDIGIKDTMDLDFLDFDNQFCGSNKGSGEVNNNGLKHDGDLDQIIPFGQMEGRQQSSLDLDPHGMSMYGEGLVSGQTTVVASPIASPKKTPSKVCTHHLHGQLDTPGTPRSPQVKSIDRRQLMGFNGPGMTSSPLNSAREQTFSPFKQNISQLRLPEKVPASPKPGRACFNLGGKFATADPGKKLHSGYMFSPSQTKTGPVTKGIPSPAKHERQLHFGAPSAGSRLILEPISPARPSSPPWQAGSTLSKGKSTEQSSEGVGGTKSVTFASPLANINNISFVSLSGAASQDVVCDSKAAGASESLAELKSEDHKPITSRLYVSQGPSSAEGCNMVKQGTSTFCYKPQVNLPSKRSAPLDLTHQKHNHSAAHFTPMYKTDTNIAKEDTSDSGESYGTKISQEGSKYTSRPLESPFDQGYFSVGSPSLCASSQCESSEFGKTVTPPPLDEQSVNEKVMHFLQKSIPGSAGQTQSMPLSMNRGQPNMTLSGSTCQQNTDGMRVAQVAMPRSSPSVGSGGIPQPLPQYPKVSSKELHVGQHDWNTPHGATMSGQKEPLPSSLSAQLGPHGFGWDMPPNVTLSNIHVHRKVPSPTPSKVLVAQPMMSTEGSAAHLSGDTGNQGQGFLLSHGLPSADQRKTQIGAADSGAMKPAAAGQGTLGQGGMLGSFGSAPQGNRKDTLQISAPLTPQSVGSTFQPLIPSSSQSTSASNQPHGHIKSERLQCSTVKSESVNPFAVPFPPNKTAPRSEQFVLPRPQGELNGSLVTGGTGSGCNSSMSVNGMTPQSTRLSQFSNHLIAPGHHQSHQASVNQSPLSDQFPPQGASNNVGQAGLMQVLIRDRSSAFRSHPLFPLLRDLIIADMNYYTKEFPFQLIENLPVDFDKLLQNYLQRNPPSTQYYGNHAVESVVMDALKYAHQTLIEKIQQKKDELAAANGQPGSTVDDFCERFDRAVQSSLNMSRGPNGLVEEASQFPPNQCINQTFNHQQLHQMQQQQQQQMQQQNCHSQQQQHLHQHHHQIQQQHLQQQQQHLQQQHQNLQPQQQHQHLQQQHQNLQQQQQHQHLQQQHQHLQQQQQQHQHLQQQQQQHQHVQQQQHQHVQQQQQQFQMQQHVQQHQLHRQQQYLTKTTQPQSGQQHPLGFNSIEIDFPEDQDHSNTFSQPPVKSSFHTPSLDPTSCTPTPPSGNVLLGMSSQNVLGNKNPMMPAAQTVNLRDLIPQTSNMDFHSGLHELAHADRNSESSFVSAKNSLLGGTCDSGVSSVNKRQVLPKEAVAVMLDWLRQHQDNPYPNDEEKEILMYQTRLSISQINYWFTNARRRILPKWTLKRLLDEQAQRGGSTEEITTIIEKNKLSTKEAIRLASSFKH